MKSKNQHHEIELQRVREISLLMLTMIATIGSSIQIDRVMAIETQPKQIQTALPNKTTAEAKIG